MIVSIRRPPLGQLTLPGLADVRIPDWLKDWRILAGIGAGLAVLLFTGGKAARKKRRSRMLMERLRHEEEMARLRRR